MPPSSGPAAAPSDAALAAENARLKAELNRFIAIAQGATAAGSKRAAVDLTSTGTDGVFVKDEPTGKSQRTMPSVPAADDPQ